MYICTLSPSNVKQVKTKEVEEAAYDRLAQHAPPLDPHAQWQLAAAAKLKGPARKKTKKGSGNDFCQSHR